MERAVRSVLVVFFYIEYTLEREMRPKLAVPDPSPEQQYFSDISLFGLFFVKIGAT